MELYAKTVIPGGTAVMYSANQIFVISRRQDKDADGVVNGYTFIINIEKSRYVKEKSKFPFEVSFETGIDRWSGLFDIAGELGFIAKGTKKGTYCLVDTKTGVVDEQEFKESQLATNGAFWEKMLARPDFVDAVKNKYQLSHGPIMQKEAV